VKRFDGSIHGFLGSPATMALSIEALRGAFQKP